MLPFLSKDVRTLRTRFRVIVSDRTHVRSFFFDIVRSLGNRKSLDLSIKYDKRPEVTSGIRISVDFVNTSNRIQMKFANTAGSFLSLTWSPRSIVCSVSFVRAVFP